MHPLIAAMPVKQYLTNDDYLLDFTGARYRWYFCDPDLKERFSKDRPMHLAFPNIRIEDLPAKNCEYVEYLAIFEAIHNCENQLRMVDLGAGHGRWSTVAAHVARNKGISYTLIMVEAEPVHFEEIGLCLSDNGVAETDCVFYQAAVVGDEGGREPAELPLVVSYRGLPEYSDPYAWNGQCVIRIREPHKVRELPELYHGRQLYVMGNNSRFINVPTITLNRIFARHGAMDLVIMDIQGEEANVLRGAKDMLNEYAGWIGIETHSPEIDRDIRELFSELKWEPVAENRLIPNPGLIKGGFDNYQAYRNPNFHR